MYIDIMGVGWRQGMEPPNRPCFLSNAQLNSLRSLKRSAMAGRHPTSRHEAPNGYMCCCLKDSQPTNKSKRGYYVEFNRQTSYDRLEEATNRLWYLKHIFPIFFIFPIELMWADERRYPQFGSSRVNSS